MRVPARIKCNVCNKVLANKGKVMWHTSQDYVTLRVDEAPKYIEDCSSKASIHICSRCWSKVVTHIRSEIMEDDN